MAYRIDSPVFVVSTLAAFFATFFAALLLLQRPAAEPEPQLLADPTGNPSVDAGPPELQSDPVPESKIDAQHQLQKQLEELGLRCAEGVNCFLD